MSGHGPDRSAFEGASKAELKPAKISDNDLAFMFETTYALKVTDFALTGELRQKDYNKCWDGLRSYFDGSKDGQLKKL